MPATGSSCVLKLPAAWHAKAQPSNHGIFMQVSLEHPRAGIFHPALHQNIPSHHHGISPPASGATGSGTTTGLGAGPPPPDPVLSDTTG